MKCCQGPVNDERPTCPVECPCDDAKALSTAPYWRDVGEGLAVTLAACGAAYMVFKMVLALMHLNGG